MSSNAKKQLEEVKQHIIHGRFQEGLKVIEANLKKKDISIEDKLAFLNFKAEIFYYLGNLQEALQLADQVLNESEKLDNLLLKVDALTFKSSALYWLAKVKEGIEIAEKGLKIISEIKNLPMKELAERKARLLLLKTQFKFQLGDFEKGIDVIKEALSYAEESGNKFIISHSLALLGYLYMYLENKLEKNEEYLEKAHIIATDLGNNFLLSQISISYAHLSNRRRKHEEAIDFFNKAFSLSKEIGSTLLLLYIHDMGNVYLSLYQLDKALECYQESLKYGVILKHIPYINIGYIYFLKNELEKAQEYYQKSLKISEEIGDRRVLPNILFNLISLSIELKN
ncbi:MAG: tetratricopeptide repeat protein, partial [Asgard group archaeon]|nr:tetratricopeptide repeat protein [Asgard group archaeon]